MGDETPADPFDQTGWPEFPEARWYRGVRFAIAGEQLDTPEARLDFAAALLDSDESEGLSIRTGETAVGWGGDVGAIMVIVDGLVLAGGVGGGVAVLVASARRVAKLWKRLRKKSGMAPLLSLGAAGYLCIADLARNINDDDLEALRVVHVTELLPATSQLFIHSGYGELYACLLASPTASWLYLVTSQGQVVHRSEGPPLPWSHHWDTGRELDAAGDDALNFLDDDPDEEQGAT